MLVIDMSSLTRYKIRYHLLIGCYFCIIFYYFVGSLQSMRYIIKQIPTHYLKFVVAYNNDFVDDLKKYINVEALELFTNSFFRSYPDIHTYNY